MTDRVQDETPTARPHPPRSESRTFVIDRVQGGHLAEGPDYATFRSRGTDDWLLIHTMAGSGRVAGPDGAALRTAVGDAVLLRPGSLHDYATAPGAAGWEIVFAHFHPRADWLPLLAWPQPVPGVGLLRTRGEVHRRVVATLLRSARVRAGGLRQAVAFALNALEEALLWCDTQNPQHSRNPRKPRNPRNSRNSQDPHASENRRHARTGQLDERLLRVIDHVEAHLSEPLTVARLAAHVHLSPSRLSRLFAEHLGISPQRYVERQRINRAKQLLDLTNRPVAAIARDLGWRDPLYFSQRFRHLTGHSPTAYRHRG